MLSYKLIEDINEYIKAHLIEEVPDNASSEEIIDLWNNQTEEKINCKFSFDISGDIALNTRDIDVDNTGYNPDTDFPIPAFLKGKEFKLNDFLEEPKKEEPDASIVPSKEPKKEVKPEKLERKSSFFDKYKELIGIEEIDIEDEDEIPAEFASMTSDSMAEPFVMGSMPFPGLDEKLKTIDESFTEMLFRKIDEQGITDADCYHQAQLNRSHFNKIKNDKDYHVQKETVIALALALKLNRLETDEMLTKAGFALSPSSQADLIIEYCIAHKIYDVTVVNQILYSFDQKLLGAGIRE